MRAVNGRTGLELASALQVADTLVSRVKGLLGRSALPPGHGLWLSPCNSIHTIGMRFAIDVVFLDRQRRVLAVAREVKPNSLPRLHLKAATALELPAGTAQAAGTAVGDPIRFLGEESPGCAPLT